jgi:prevent-host-death family protein
MTIRISAASARKDFANLLRRCARGERIELTRYGKSVAVMVPASDLDGENRGRTPGRRRAKP